MAEDYYDKRANLIPRVDSGSDKLQNQRAELDYKYRAMLSVFEEKKNSEGVLQASNAQVRRGSNLSSLSGITCA